MLSFQSFRKLAVMALCVGGLLLILGAILILFVPYMGGVLLVLGAVAVPSGLSVLLFHNLRVHIDSVDRQAHAIQSAIALSKVEFNHPVFFLRHAAAPDFVEIIAEVIRRRQVSRTLELGSGTTSLYMAKLLPPGNKGGRLVCLEDSVAWSKLVQSEIDALPSDRRALTEVVYAPLVSKSSSAPLFYDLEADALENCKPFELLVVDGPGNLVLRQAAAPCLKHLLSTPAVVVLDDGDQSEIRRVVQNWLAKEPTWLARYYPTVKGTWVICIGENVGQLPLP